jgi:asparagine synthase (glutamine-hydrolysing)
MCGINVIIGKNRQEDIQTMMQSTKHRGPDHSSSCEVTPNLFFAGNRLKILDLSSYSDQPLWSPEKDALLVWNGALYNYQDLRNTLLEQGYQFQSNSDSEVLLYWLKQFGQEGIKDLKGMFALAFADMNKNKIIIARDPSGEKPLYYANKKDTYYFSSEVQAIQNALSEKSSIDKDQFAYYYYLRHPNPQDSFFY